MAEEFHPNVVSGKVGLAATTTVQLLGKQGEL